MNTHLSSPDPKADQEAALWAARLDGGTLSVPDRTALNNWLNQEPGHRALLSAYCQLSSDLERHLPALAADLELTNATAPRARPRSRWALGAAVILAAAAAIAVIVWSGPTAEQSERFATAVGERVERTLADGSRVQLNAQSTLVVDISRDERRVRLGAGQAFFAVTPDASRPFIVDTPAGAVRVTGTEFDVRYDPATALEVIVAEGSVQVREGDGHQGSSVTQLVAGDHYRGGAEPVVRALSAPELRNTLAWREGQIVFEGTPLREALARFGRFHGRGISASAEAGELPIGGRYSLDDLEGFLASLEDIFPVQVTQSLGGTFHVRLRAEPVNRP